MQESLREQLYDIYGMAHVPWWQTTTFMVVGLLLILAAVSAVIYLLVQRARAKKLQKTAWDRAIHDITQLRKEPGMTVATSKQFYDRMIFSIKQYLHHRYQLDTFGKTDQELIVYLQKSEFPRELVEKLQTIVNGSVLVRFGNEQAVLHQMEQDCATAIIIIKQTIPTPSK